MRIISGSAKGRKLQSPKGMGTRPTSDRVREAIFSIIGDRVVNARILDLYSGTGAMGLEALSRGAREAVFVERDRRATRFLSANIEACGFKEMTRIVVKEVGAFLKPVDNDAEYDVVLEHSPENEPGPAPPGMEAIDSRRYGNVCVAFYVFRDQEMSS
jgi:16S rRNA (guanine(966)-N(2))-methyltransferase RsmD